MESAHSVCFLLYQRSVLAYGDSYNFIQIIIIQIIIINWQPTPEYFIFRLVATFQECCLKALSSRERFFKVINVLVIERSVDWRLPIQFVFCFPRDQLLPMGSHLVSYKSIYFFPKGLISKILYLPFNMANQSGSYSHRGFYGTRFIY